MRARQRRRRATARASVETSRMTDNESGVAVPARNEDAGTPGALPEWVVEELPPAYAEIARQIQALREEAVTYEGVAGVLWQTGSALTSAVAQLFTALQFETQAVDSGSNFDLTVNLESERRLLVVVVGGGEGIDRRSPHLAQILRALQEDAGERDRVVLAANLFADTPVTSRPPDPVTVDAMRLIQGLGANFVPTSTLFGIWKRSLQDRAQARKSVLNLYAMDGGIFR
jgi:hypothetical protein